MGGESWSGVCGFESQRCILEGTFSHVCVVKIVTFVWNDKNKRKREAGDGPFYKNNSMLCNWFSLESLMPLVSSLLYSYFDIQEMAKKSRWSILTPPIKPKAVTSQHRSYWSIQPPRPILEMRGSWETSWDVLGTQRKSLINNIFKIIHQCVIIGFEPSTFWLWIEQADHRAVVVPLFTVSPLHHFLFILAVHNI